MKHDHGDVEDAEAYAKELEEEDSEIKTAMRREEEADARKAKGKGRGRGRGRGNKTSKSKKAPRRDLHNIALRNLCPPTNLASLPALHEDTCGKNGDAMTAATNASPSEDLALVLL